MKVLCIGRNYRDHASELENPVPEEPLFFLKPESAVLEGGGAFHYPDHTKELHYETELVVRIGMNGRQVGKEEALRYIAGIGIGLDLTARDQQRALKEKGHPWEKAKAFDASAPVSEEFIPLDRIPELSNLPFTCYRNGELVQSGNSGEMIFSFEDLIVHLSSYITLAKGDLIFTGTPSGVGPLVVGDRLECWIGRRSFLNLFIE